MKADFNSIPQFTRSSSYAVDVSCRWSHVMIEEVSEGPLCDTKIIANYKAKYNDANRVRAVKIDDPPFDTSCSINFSGF